MVRIDQAEECSTVLAGPVRLTFRWDGLRWSHELSAHGQPLATSFEMEPGRDDPDRVVTPAYQYLNFQECEDGAQALLVGQWGANHCSGVLTARERNGLVSIEADVAVRSRVEPRRVAATYLVHRTPGDLHEASPSSVAWNLDVEPPASILRIEAGETGRLSLAEGGRQNCRVQVSHEATPGSATQRFYYCWRWLDAAGSR